MSQRASWDWKEVCGQSIPQLEQGCKRACGVKVRSPAVFSVSGLTLVASASGGAGGLTPPHHTQGSLEKGRGLVLGKTKSDEVVAEIREVEVDAVRHTHPPR